MMDDGFSEYIQIESSEEADVIKKYRAGTHVVVSVEPTAKLKKQIDVIILYGGQDAAARMYKLVIAAAQEEQ